MSIDETFDVGIDTRTPVDDSYKLPFRFTGKIDKLTFNLGREQIDGRGTRGDAEGACQSPRLGRQGRHADRWRRSCGARNPARRPSESVSKQPFGRHA